MLVLVHAVIFSVSRLLGVVNKTQKPSGVYSYLLLFLTRHSVYFQTLSEDTEDEEDDGVIGFIRIDFWRFLR